jgi:hypothetical protein
MRGAIEASQKTQATLMAVLSTRGCDEAMHPAGSVGVVPDDVAIRIDPEYPGRGCTGVVNRVKTEPLPQKPVEPGRIPIDADYSTIGTDIPRRGKGAARRTQQYGVFRPRTMSVAVLPLRGSPDYFAEASPKPSSLDSGRSMPCACSRGRRRCDMATRRRLRMCGGSFRRT